MAFQAPFWAGVGAEKAPRNQSRVGRLNRSMASASRVPTASSCPVIPPSCPKAPTLLDLRYFAVNAPMVSRLISGLLQASVGCARKSEAVSFGG